MSLRQALSTILITRLFVCQIRILEMQTFLSKEIVKFEKWMYENKLILRCQKGKAKVFVFGDCPASEVTE